VCAGLAGAVSRTATAPVDRVKLLLQVQDSAHALTVRDGWNRMVSEGLPLASPLFHTAVHLQVVAYLHTLTFEGSAAPIALHLPQSSQRSLSDPVRSIAAALWAAGQAAWHGVWDLHVPHQRE